MKKKKVAVVFTLLLFMLLIIFFKISFEPFGNYSNKKNSACLLYEGKIIGFDFTKIQTNETGRSYVPLYIKLNKKHREGDYKNFVFAVIRCFESVASVKVTNWQIDSSQSFYDFLNNYEGRINGLWVEYESN